MGQRGTCCALAQHASLAAAWGMPHRFLIALHKLVILRRHDSNACSSLPCNAWTTTPACCLAASARSVARSKLSRCRCSKGPWRSRRFVGRRGAAGLGGKPRAPWLSRVLHCPPASFGHGTTALAEVLSAAAAPAAVRRLRYRYRQPPCRPFPRADRPADPQRLDPHPAAQVGGRARPPDRAAQCHWRRLQVCVVGCAAGAPS